MVRLVGSGHVAIVEDRLEASRTEPDDPQDPMLISAMTDIRQARRPPLAGDWVRGRGQRTVDAYLATLDAKGYVRTERRKILGLTMYTRWYVVDAERQGRARARLDEVAYGAWVDVDVDVEAGADAHSNATPALGLAGAALAGLVGAIGLGRELYPGPANEAARERLASVGRLGGIPGLATHLAGDAMLRAVRQATDIALHVALDAALDASHTATDMTIHHGGHGGAIGHH